MFQIRAAALEDCPGIARVQVDSYRTAYAGLFPEAYLQQFTYAEQEQDWVQLLTSGMQDILLAAVSPQGQVIGYVLARAQADIYPGYDAEVIALHVRQASRGQGAGRALLRAAVEGLSARGCRSVMLWTLEGNPTRAWYEKLRGRLQGEKSYEVEGREVREVAYGWEDLAALA